MKLVQPIAVTDAMLMSSSVPENDYPAWSSSTTYAAGARVIRLHRIYESAISGNLDIDPAAAGPAIWIDVGPTNRWAMFDSAAGPRTTATTPIIVTLAPGQAVLSLGLLDIGATSVRVQLSAGGPDLYDDTVTDPGANLSFLDLPVVDAPIITVTVAPINGAADVGKLIIGNALDLGVTETGPTIGLSDFSRRETDAFGITTIVERGWARRVTLRSRMASSVVDEVQRRLAAARATPALWIGEPGFESLTLYGYYKEFSIDLQLGEISYCSLTIEGLPEAATNTAIVDPAPGGSSDFKVVRPIPVAGSVLQASSVPENDYPEWSAATNYAFGARVIRAATHRVYESAVAANVGNDPATGAVQWIDVGPTNRWAMFDEALGSLTTATGQIVVTLAPGAELSALAVLDTDAASVRVQAPGYDQTKDTLVDGEKIATLTFLDLATSSSDTVTVTIAAATAGASVSAGTLMIGTLEPLGVTETSPTVAILDYSVKGTDDFGSTTTIERAWAKRLAVRSLVATPALDGLLRRLASLRAKPALWIGQEGFDSLTVYGFYRDFSVEIAERLSVCSFAIEGLSMAAPLKAPEPPIRWVGDWSPNELYPRNAVVRFEERPFASLVDNNLGNQPPSTPTDSPYWFLVTDRGADGSNGTPGPPGANGQTSYVHFAWANSADGATGFSTTVSAGKLYIGVYTDFVEADSTNPAAYSWTKIKGDDGLQGPEGTPGAPGANGQTTYFHVAYADNATGTLNFTTGDPGSRTYIGVYSDFTAADSANPASYTWSKYVGADGANGTPGAPGANGQTSYVHFAWANSADGTSGFSTTVSTGKLYIGVYSDFTLADSSNPALYSWSKIKGEDGLQGPEGTPGAPGANGQTSYFHVAYADSADGVTNFTTGDPGNRAYIGVYSDFVAADSNSPAAYTWSKYKGADGANGTPGAPGANGQTSYVHFAWANSADGTSGFSTTVSAGKLYIGVYSDFTLADSTNPALYSWSLIKGDQGIPGTPGTNGQPSYVHFAYADSADGTVNFTTGAPGGRYYVGVYTDFTASDSSNPASYAWSLQRGADGSNGTPGAPGANGQPSYVHIAYANNASGTLDFSVSDPTGRAYIGVYTDFTLADSTNPASYTWSLIKGSDGVSPIALELSVYAMDVAADANNVTKAGALPKGSVVSLKQGTTTLVPSSVNFTYSDGGAGAFAADYGVIANTVRLTTANAPGWVDVNVVYAGLTYTKRIAISRTQDPQAPPSQTSAYTGVVGGSGSGSTTYDGSGILSPELVLKANGSGQIIASASGEYYTDTPPASVRTLTVAMRVEIAPLSTGVWSAPLSENIGTQAFWDKTDATPGLVNTGGTFTGLTAGADYRIRVNTRKVSGSNPSVNIDNGGLSVSQ